MIITVIMASRENSKSDWNEDKERLMHESNLY